MLILEKITSYSSVLGSFYNLPCVADFIIDILLGSPSAEVRVFENFLNI